MQLSREQLARVVRRYGYGLSSVCFVKSGYRNTSHGFVTDDEKDLNFILYKNELGVEEIIKRVNLLSRRIADKGLPVRHPVDNRVIKVGYRFGALYNCLDGDTIPWEAYTMKHIKLLGLAMARFHEASHDLDGVSLPSVVDIYQKITKHMGVYFSDSGVKLALRSKLGVTVSLPDFKKLLINTALQEDQIPLHMDLVRSNVLFRGAKEGDMFTVGGVALSGIIDLEKTAIGNRMFDVARTLAFLLVDCQKPTEKIYKYFLDSGYRKRGDGSVATGPIFDELVTMFLVYDLYKFLKQNPYESLLANHHFMRTVDILRARKVV